jgi:AraC-like DNA-binding protein
MASGTRVNQHVNERARAMAQTDMLAAQRAKQVIELRLQGWEFADIAEQCGYRDPSGAYRAWKRHLQSIPKAAVEDARLEMRMRLFRAMRQLEASKARGTDPRVFEAYAKLEERYAKLFGLDVPTEQAATPIVPIVREYPEGVAEAV